MSVKDKLVELIFGSLCKHIHKSCNLAENIADDLIANGVTISEWIPENDYYVLRNAETGMYFRGKGANRWGKHFNQATIYRVKGTAEHSIKEIAWRGEKAELVRIKIVELPEPPKEDA